MQGATRHRRLVHQTDKCVHMAPVRKREFDTAPLQRKAEAAESVTKGRAAGGQSVPYFAPGRREEPPAKLRYIRDGVGCRDTVRYFADLFSE